MLLWVRQLQMAVSQVLCICCCQILDDKCCVCYYCVAMSDVWYLQNAFGQASTGGEPNGDYLWQTCH